MFMENIEHHAENKFVEFLRSKFKDRGEQAKAARKIGLSQTAFSRWVSGVSDPDFESCLRIARYFKISPIEIFEMAGLDSYTELFASFFPEHVAAYKVTIDDVFPKREHARAHAVLQDILENYRDDVGERTIEILDSFHAIYGLRKHPNINEEK